ncbi:MAG: adenine glycosylase [Coriobacteriia bacterium]|nr:adenine glycosylase [Coriobacteriia bacterium]
MSKSSPLNNDQLKTFTSQVVTEGHKHYRDFAWRNTRDPYAILLSEVMLQQTQVVRVIDYFGRWLLHYPTIDALAAADTADVLTDWQGLGYNRRALALKRLAVQVSEEQSGILPTSYEELQQLPGVGPATAAGVMAFAHNEFAPYLETNVRSVVLHELFSDHDEVCDKDIMAVVQQVAQYLEDIQQAADSSVWTTQRTQKAPFLDARTWNYALLDYGAWLKKTFPNPSRRSKQHTKQSRFEGSFRQKRAQLLREILAESGQTADKLATKCSIDLADTEKALRALAEEGFIQCDNDTYSISEQ